MNLLSDSNLNADFHIPNLQTNCNFEFSFFEQNLIFENDISFLDFPVCLFEPNKTHDIWLKIKFNDSDDSTNN